MEENLPEIQPDSSAARRPQGQRSLVVTSGGEIYLPASRPVKQGDADFADIVEDVLPEYAASLSDEALRRPRGYPAWAVLLLLLYFALLFAGFFFLKPQVRLETTSTDVPPPENSLYRGKFSGKLEEAEKFVKSKRYKDARTCLSPVIDELIAKWEQGSGQKNEAIFRAYFDLFNHEEWDHAAANQLNELIKLDDNYRWKLFNIKRLLEEMGGGELGKLSDKAKRIKPDFFDGIIRQIDGLRKAHPELERQLDLYECHFKLKKWRHLNTPKANADSGAEEREQVWRTACRYPKDENFRRIRRYLVEMLKNDMGIMHGFITFNREKIYFKKKLDEYLEQSDRGAGQEVKK